MSCRFTQNSASSAEIRPIGQLIHTFICSQTETMVRTVTCRQVYRLLKYVFCSLLTFAPRKTHHIYDGNLSLLRYQCHSNGYYTLYFQQLQAFCKKTLYEPRRYILFVFLYFFPDTVTVTVIFIFFFNFDEVLIESFPFWVCFEENVSFL